MKQELPFRQIHLDFHTSGLIPGVGERFDKKKWQEALKRTEADSVTLFAVCHHGWAYYDTKIGRRHPQLKFDLLRAQMEACAEIGVKTPIYLSGGYNDAAAEQHADWCEIQTSGRIYDPLYPHFHKLCFNTPYLQFLCGEIREVLTLFPEANGIFIDIINQNQCCCPCCRRGMLEAGLNPLAEADRKKFAAGVLKNYYRQTTAAVRELNPEMPLFHNSGHIAIGNRDILHYFSHFELESLPTGGWGYDHFPMSAAYVRNLGKDFLGMTGKFQTTWGEFGGFKHPNALRYECAAMLAQGAKCSIGDQLHPDGAPDESTCESIGRAYREVKTKEPWCRNSQSAAELAVLSTVLPERPAANPRDLPAETGACRLLLESHIPFELVDSEMEWSRYRWLLLPDDVRLTPPLAAKLRKFTAAGGKLILSGRSGMALDRDEFLLPMPFSHQGTSPYEPDYLLADKEFAPEYLHSPLVMYLASQRITAENGRTLGKIFDPYFNRRFDRFCGHQHTPYQPEATAFDAGVLGAEILYFAHPVFTIYRMYGAAALKAFVFNALRTFMGQDLQLETTLPSQGRATLRHQPAENRYVLHLLYANTVLRGGVVTLSGGNAAGSGALEVIEELNPVGPVQVSLKLTAPVQSVRLVPSGKVLPYTVREGRVEFTVPQFICHEMAEIRYEI